MPRKKKQRIILCCGANGRAVIIGDVTEEPKAEVQPDGSIVRHPVRLTDARMLLRWDVECGGLLGFSKRGPRAATRITEATPWVVETVWQEALAVSLEAAREIDKWPAC